MTNQNSSAATAPATTEQVLPPQAFLTQMAFAHVVTQALYVAAKLGVADLIADGARPVSELAAETKTNERALYRVLRSLASVGVFKETDPKVFALTPYADALRADVPGSMRNNVIFMGAEWHWRVLGNMLYSVQTGKPAWGHTHGVEVFEFFNANPEAAEIFNRAMTGMSVGTAAAVVEAYDFSGTKTLADIAGGHGYMLAHVLKGNPNIKGILFDMPSVIAGAQAILDKEGVAERVEQVAGDFFASVPEGADTYMTKSIIHDWDDERAVKILKNIQKVLPGDGRLLLVELVVPESDEPHFSKLLDLEMLCSPGGQERTESEFRELLAAAGLRLTRIIPTKSPYSVIEAVKEQG